MRIGMILSTPLPPREGIGFYVWNLARFLTGEGHSVQIITRGGARPTAREVVDGIPVWRPPFLPFYPLHVHFHSLFVDRLLRRLEPELDLLHLHTPLVKCPNTALPALVTVHTPVKAAVAAVGSDTALGVLTRLQAPVSISLERKLLRCARGLCTVSSTVARDLEPYDVHPADVGVLGNGVDTVLFTPEGAAQRDPTDYVLTAGRLDPRKGLEDLIACAGLLVPQAPGVKVCIAGSGPLARRLKAEVSRRQLGEVILFLGHIADRQRLAELYRGATAYLHPAHYEGLPTVLLEAMACGRPVVATAVGGALDVIQDGQNGLLVPPRAPGQMAEAVVRLLREPEVGRRLGAAARTTMVERYSWEVIGRRHLDQYGRTLNHAAPSRAPDELRSRCL